MTRTLEVNARLNTRLSNTQLTRMASGAVLHEPVSAKAVRASGYWANLVGVPHDPGYVTLDQLSE